MSNLNLTQRNNLTHPSDEPSYLVTTCCYGNCAKWSHGSTATHRWFTPRSALPFVALCKGHAKQKRDAGEDVVAYTTLVREASRAFGVQYDAEKRSRRSILGRMSDAMIDRDLRWLDIADEKSNKANTRARALCWLGGSTDWVRLQMEAKKNVKPGLDQKLDHDQMQADGWVGVA